MMWARAFAALLAVVTQIEAHGAAHADASIGSEYNSNVFLDADNGVASASLVANAGVGYDWSTDLTRVALNVDGRYQPYSDSSLTPVSAIGVTTNLDREHEYGATRLGLGYRNESSLISAFDIDGRLVDDERRDVAFASAQRSFETSESTAWIVDIDGIRTKYVDTPPGTFREDYDFATGAVRRQWLSGERATWSAGVVGSWFRSEGDLIVNEVTTAGPELSLALDISETLSASAAVSYRKTRSDTTFFDLIEIHDDDSDYFGSVQLKKELERGYLSIDGSRSVQPGSSGRQDTHDEVTIAFAHQLTERLSMNARATGLENESRGDVARVRRTAFLGNLFAEFALGERLFLSAGYYYVWQDGETASLRADGHTVFAGLRCTLGGDS